MGNNAAGKTENKSGPATLAACPFCGGKVYAHSGETGLSLITCGQRDDGSDGCGLVASFRPNLSGDALREAWARRDRVARLESLALDNWYAEALRWGATDERAREYAERRLSELQNNIA